jgi:hypothetical protein
MSTVQNTPQRDGQDSPPRTAWSAARSASTTVLRRILAALLPALALVAGAMTPALAAQQEPPRQVAVQISPVDLAAQDTIQTVAVTVTNSSRSAMRGTTISLRGPAGWTTSPASQSVDGKIQPGAKAVRTFEVRVPTLREGFRTHEFTADITYTGGDGHGSVTGQRVQISGEPLESFEEARDNVGTTDLDTLAAGDFDGEGNSFSDEALAEAGVVPGASIEGAGATFEWPDSAPDAVDSAAATGQAFRLDGAGSSLALLASGSSLNASGKVTVHYTDGTASTGYVSVPNWTGAGAGADTAEEVVAVAGRNTPDGYGNEEGTYRLYAVSVPLEQGREIEAVQLPSNASLHVFDVRVVG